MPALRSHRILFHSSLNSKMYASLKKTSFTPPNWVFAPVWITLYTLMGISAFLVWREREKGKRVGKALTVYGAQLALNTIWSLAFFGLRSPIMGLLVIIVLWFMILLTVWEFYRISRTAAILLLPYIGWVSLAVALNYAVFIMNT